MASAGGEIKLKTINIFVAHMIRELMMGDVHDEHKMLTCNMRLREATGWTSQTIA